MDRKPTPFTALSASKQALTAETFLAVHRSFVNEPPRLLRLPPLGHLQVFEDHKQRLSVNSVLYALSPRFVAFQVMHKASEQLVERMLTCFLSARHGRLALRSPCSTSFRAKDSISKPQVANISLDGKRMDYRSGLYEVNDFLAQVQYFPDANYYGPDELEATKIVSLHKKQVLLTDGEYSVNSSVSIEIISLTDPLIIEP